MTKTYPDSINKQLVAIGAELRTQWRASGKGLVTFAKECNLSVNSVKSIFKGHTGNIASYMMIALTLGQNLESIISKSSGKEEPAKEGALFT